MAQYINKSALVAEIEKRIDKDNQKAASYSSNSEHDYLYRVKEAVYKSLLAFIDTLDEKFTGNEPKVQPKQWWTEEDESMHTRCIGILGKCYMGELPTKVEEELNWLKSLKDKVHPKNPWSEEDEKIRKES